MNESYNKLELLSQSQSQVRTETPFVLVLRPIPETPAHRKQ